MIKKLLVRPNPFPDESLLGYIIRLTEQNGYDKPSDLLNLLPSSNDFLSGNYFKLSRFNQLSRKLFYDLANLAQKDYQTIFNLTVFAFGEKSPSSFWVSNNHNIVNPNLQKFCSLCLIEEKYYRKIWDLIIITVCPIHKCLLHNICSQCNKPMEVIREFVCQCQCGFDFRHLKAILVPENETVLAKHIFLLTGMWKNNNADFSMKNPLINYPFEDFCNIVFYFVAKIISLESNKRFSLSQLNSIGDLHRIVSEAFLIFEDFPNNYLIYLNKLVQYDIYRTSYNWFNYFAPSYQDYYKLIPDSFLTLLYKIFDENIREIVVRNNKKVTKAKFSKLTSVSELANQLGISTNQTVDLTNSLFNLRYMREGKSYLFDGDSFIKIMNKIRSNKKIRKIKVASLMNLNQISKYLCNFEIKLHYFLVQVLRGNINAYYEDVSAKGLNRFLFREKDVIEFVKN